MEPSVCAMSASGSRLKCSPEQARLLVASPCCIHALHADAPLQIHLLGCLGAVLVDTAIHLAVGMRDMAVSRCTVVNASHQHPGGRLEGGERAAVPGEDGAAAGVPPAAGAPPRAAAPGETPMWHSTAPCVGSHHSPGSGHVKVLEDRCQSQAVHAWRNSSSEGLWIETSDFDEDDCICAGRSWWPWHSRGLATACWQWTVQGDLCCKC